MTNCSTVFLLVIFFVAYCWHDDAYNQPLWRDPYVVAWHRKWSERVGVILLIVLVISILGALT